MAVNYTSEFTGQHNDQYDERITSLLNTVQEQQQTITSLTNRIITIENELKITDLSNSLNIISNKVTSAYFYIYGHIATLMVWLGPGVSDQTTLLYYPSIYQPKTNGYSSVSSFYMNGEDATKELSGYIGGARLEFRCTSQTTGSSGVILFTTWIF